MAAPLASFELECDLRAHWWQLWRDTSFYMAWLEQQGDIDVVLSPWEPRKADDMAGENCGHVLERDVSFAHPVKVSFPGTPSHTQCFRQQTASLSDGSESNGTRCERIFELREQMRFEGIPYSDYFTVTIAWRVEELNEALSAASTEVTCSKCRVTVTCEVVFLKSTWLSGTIRSNTESELRDAVLLWQQRAENALSNDFGLDGNVDGSPRDRSMAESLGQNDVTQSRSLPDNIENRSNDGNKNSNSNSKSAGGAVPSWFTPTPPTSSPLLPLKPPTLTRADSSQSRLSLASRSDADDSDADFFDVGSFNGASDSDSVMSSRSGRLPSSLPAPLTTPPPLLREPHNTFACDSNPATATSIANAGATGIDLGDAIGYQFSRPFYPSSLPAHLRYYPGVNHTHNTAFGNDTAAAAVAAGVNGRRGRDVLGRVLPSEEGENMASSSPFELAQSLAAALCGVTAVVLQFAWWRLHQDWSVARWAPFFSPSPQSIKQNLIGALLPLPWLKCVVNAIRQQQQQRLASCSGHREACENLTYNSSSSGRGSSTESSGRRRSGLSQREDGWRRGTDDLVDRAASFPLLNREPRATANSDKKSAENIQISCKRSNGDLRIDVEEEEGDSSYGSGSNSYDNDARQRESSLCDNISSVRTEEAEVDLFGPLILALTLAQVVLWCVDVQPLSLQHVLTTATTDGSTFHTSSSDSTATAHDSNPAMAVASAQSPTKATSTPPFSTPSHCERKTLLGTAMVVSFSAWGAASLWYFLLCYLCGAKQFKLLHAASHAGYGLFGWCLGLIAAQSSALLLSQQWAEPGGLLLLPSPHHALLAFGLPSGVALATTLAHFVPLKHSTHGNYSLARKRDDDNNEVVDKNQTTGDCDDETEEVNEGATSGSTKGKSRSWFRASCSCLSRSLRSKRDIGSNCCACFGPARCICFLLVLLTHVELLRYLYLVVVPGEQKRCAVWSSLRPEDFARFDAAELALLADALRGST